MSLLLPWLLNLKWSQAIYWVLALDEFDDRQASDLWWCLLGACDDLCNGFLVSELFQKKTLRENKKGLMFKSKHLPRN